MRLAINRADQCAKRLLFNNTRYFTNQANFSSNFTFGGKNVNSMKLSNEQLQHERQKIEFATHKFVIAPTNVSIQQLQRKNREELKQFFLQMKLLNNEDLLSIRLKGIHLYNAIQLCLDNLKSGETIVTAKQRMVHNLMEEEKVSSKSIAELISNWLYSTYILKKENDLIDWSDSERILQFFEWNGIKKRQQQSKLALTVGAQFPFIAKDTQIEQFLSFLLDQIMHEGVSDRNCHPIPFCAAGPKSEKSRLNQEMIDCVKSKLEQYLQQNEEKRVNFFKNEQLRTQMKLLEQNKELFAYAIDLLRNIVSLSITFGNKEVENSEKAIAFRILYSYFDIGPFLGESPTAIDYTNSFEKFFLGQVTLYNVLKLIRVDSRRDKIILYLGVNEFDNPLISPDTSVITTELKSMLTLIGNFMCTNYLSIILVPFFTGTTYASIKSLISTHPPLQI